MLTSFPDVEKLNFTWSVRVRANVPSAFCTSTLKTPGCAMYCPPLNTKVLSMSVSPLDADTGRRSCENDVVAVGPICTEWSRVAIQGVVTASENNCDSTPWH